MPYSALLLTPLEKLTLLITILISYTIFLFILFITYSIGGIGVLLQRTGFFDLLNRLPVRVKGRWDDRQYKRRERNKKLTEDLQQDESLQVGRKEKEQMKEAMRRVGWKRGVGKMEYGIDLKEDERLNKGKMEGKEGKEEEWVDDELFMQDQKLLEKLEAKADFGIVAGGRDRVVEREQLRNRKSGDMEEFPRFEG